MTGRKECLVKTRADMLEHEIILVNNKKLQCDGIGGTSININNQSVPIKDVLYVPGVGLNLLSVSQMTVKSLNVVFTLKRCDIYQDKNEREVALATKSKPYNRRFILKCYKCHQQGHKTSECNSKNEKQNKGKPGYKSHDKSKNDRNNFMSSWSNLLLTKSDVKCTPEISRAITIDS
ncbi:hypothetical protein ILUMI_26387 [Ignelater luminosus]|uniref:CCHC-type domain-containing protein n=1 Tax=Ignelater luminosus TaxID=2038154 RepID=A0A8K0C6L6_IGNLU|nr:hypothetical protein ILUMI_26387 [Ignelater luminosus]